MNNLKNIPCGAEFRWKGRRYRVIEKTGKEGEIIKVIVRASGTRDEKCLTGEAVVEAVEEVKRWPDVQR